MGWVHAGKYVATVWLLFPLQEISCLVAREALSTPERVGAAPMLLKTPSLVAGDTLLTPDILASQGVELGVLCATGHET